MKKHPGSIEKFLRQLQQHDPEISEEVQATMEATRSREGTTAMVAQASPETIVLTTGRPVLDVRRDEAVLDITEVESQIWQDRLARANDLLADNIPAVGRIELANHARGVDWVGTGWLVRDNIVVTNRHVAEVFGHTGVDGFEFRIGLDGTKVRANIDFLEEFDNESSSEFPVFRIMHIEKGGGPDLAFLRIEPARGQSLPTAVKLAQTPAKEGDHVAVIGYPARDPFFPDPQLMDRIFSHRYDKKRLAPGLVTGTTSARIFHDCTTLGGNSGGEVVSLNSGEAVALHFAGTLFSLNHAVPADVVASRLDDALRPRPKAAPPSGGSEVQIRPSTPVAVSPNPVIEATIPIHIRIELGHPTPPAVQPIAPSTAIPGDRQIVGDDVDDDLIEITEARPEDYLDRDGYDPQFLGAPFAVPLPVLTRDQDDTVTYEFDGRTREVLDYRHFSVLMSRKRRMCRFSACNLNGNQSKKKKRKGWRFDPRIPISLQIMKECYGNEPKFSRGHMTRREDPVWGSSADASQGNVDSMHVTNAVPQIQPFNAGIWLDLEDFALDNAREDEMRISVFTGPFLSRFDPHRFEVKIPITFWKVIAFIHDETGELSATGYTMSQKSFIGDQEFVFGQHENRQRPIAEIGQRAGIDFGILADVDPLAEMVESTPTLLASPSQIRWR